MHSPGSSTQGSVMFVVTPIKALLTISRSFVVRVRVTTFGTISGGSEGILVDGGGLLVLLTLRCEQLSMVQKGFVGQKGLIVQSDPVQGLMVPHCVL